jgi:hypothetical protein
MMSLAETIEFLRKNNRPPYLPEEIALILHIKQIRAHAQYGLIPVQHFMEGFNIHDGFRTLGDRGTKQTFFATLNNTFNKLPIQARFQLLTLYDMNQKHWVLFDIKKMTTNKISIFYFDPANLFDLQGFDFYIPLKKILTNIPTVEVRSTCHFEIQCDHSYCGIFAIDASSHLSQMKTLHEILAKHPCPTGSLSILITDLDPNIAARLTRNCENADEDYYETVLGWKNHRVNHPSKPIKTLEDRIKKYTPTNPTTNMHYKNSYGYWAIADKSKKLIEKVFTELKEQPISENQYEQIFYSFTHSSPQEIISQSTIMSKNNSTKPCVVC